MSVAGALLAVLERRYTVDWEFQRTEEARAEIAAFVEGYLRDCPGLARESSYPEVLRRTGGLHAHDERVSFGLYGFGYGGTSLLEGDPLVDDRWFRFADLVLPEFEDNLVFAFDQSGVHRERGRPREGVRRSSDVSRRGPSLRRRLPLTACLIALCAVRCSSEPSRALVESPDRPAGLYQQEVRSEPETSSAREPAPAASPVVQRPSVSGEPSPPPTAPGEWVLVKAGSFMMGSPTSEKGRFHNRGAPDGNETQHLVTLTRDFYLQATEVTQGQWREVMGYDPSHVKGCGASCPVESVSWYDAAAYCNALSKGEQLPECYKLSGCSKTPVNNGVCTSVSFAGLDCRGYRLPTEAEWEYAARAGTTGSRYGALDDVAWYFRNARMRPHPVKGKLPNAWGLYGMLGNSSEWTNDRFVVELGSDAVTDPTGPETGERRVLRGGDWSNTAEFSRAAYRGGYEPTILIIGFRPARSVE